MIGYQSINCKPYVEETKKSNAFTFLISLCKFRILNMENEQGRKLLYEAINHPNLLEKNIKKELKKELSSEYELINKINNKLYDDKSKEKSLKSIKRICNKEDPNNKTKIDNRKRKNIKQNLENPLIKEIISKEKKINMVLDNARIHTAKMIQKAVKILNINLIYLRPYGIVILPTCREPVTDVAHGPDEVIELAELRAQPADVHVDGAGAAEIVVAPHLTQQHLAGQHLALMLHQVAEQQFGMRSGK